jgi:bifunctional UDP-N-acetylglucosamine pyrophosphorylase/glucosamine-1-phosphate N-acetyltransferase
VLAAGKGKRMRSDLPKVLHPAAGRPLLSWVIEAARSAGCERILVIVGHGAQQVREVIGDAGVEWVLQAEQKGTGHALAQAEPHLQGDAMLLVLSGDVPLVSPATLNALADEAEEGWGAMAVAELDEPGSLGRVLASPDGNLRRIVEAADALPEELAVRRINAGLYALPAPEVFDYLRQIGTDNAQGELYLTDAVGDAARDGRQVKLLTLADPDEGLGVNDQAELARVHQRLLDRHPASRLLEGVRGDKLEKREED